MKFWILLFSAALFAGGTCVGVALRPTLVPPPPPAPAPKPAYEPWGRHEISVTRFAHELGLSEEQDVELDRILEDTHRDSEAYGRALRGAHERARGRVTGLLSAEQKTKLDDLLADERRRRSEGEAKKAVDAYTRILRLSPEQAKTVGEIFAQHRQRRSEFYGDDKKRDRESHRAFSRKLKEEQHSKMRAALSPEQFETYMGVQDLFEDRRGL